MLNGGFLSGAMRAAILGCALAAGLAQGPAARADDVDAFQKALHARNSAHLDAAFPPPWQDTGSLVQAFYSEEGEKGPWALRIGGLALSVEITRTAPIDLSQFPVPVLTVSLAGKQVISSRGAQGPADFAAFLAQIVEMDPDNPYPEIVFSSYTGGAHCCSDTRILTSSKDGKRWSEIEAGEFDGDLLKARDVDGDNRFELAMRDNRFLYRFGCYACSAAPFRILQLRKGKLADVSGEKPFRDVQEQSLVRMIRFYSGGSEESNPFLAGYVAQKIRLGEGRQAWDFMLKFHDRKSDWGLSECSVPLNDRNECTGKTTTYTFPDALKRFLVESGYPLPD